MKRMKKVLKKYKDVLAYLFFGVCTTLINIITYYICAHSLSLSTGVSTIAAWIISVLFAYITNKLWVFESKSWKRDVVIKEAISFFACRLATGAFDLVFMMVTVDVLGLADIWMKIISNVVVIILNYVASKLLVFRKKGREEQK